MTVPRRVCICLAMIGFLAPAISSPSAGAFGPTEFRPVSPRRVLDTRTGVGAAAAKVGPGQTITLQIAGSMGIPASGIEAVSVNFTVTGATAASYLTVWPDGQSRPTASILNFAAAQTIANSTVVAVSSAGRIKIYNKSGSTHVIADISGWFPTGSDLVPATPVRLLDTRTGNGASAVKVGAGQSITVQISGRGGVPVGVAGVVLNLTATGPTKNGYLTMWPAGQSRPTVSTLNFVAGRTIANSTTVGLSAAGRLSIYNSAGSTDIIADISGWFPAATDMSPVTPARVADTRSGIGGPAAKVGAGQTRHVKIAGVGGIPAVGVSAVSINLTSTRSTASSYLTVWPMGQTRPTASLLNFPAGRTIANSALVALSSDGYISIYNSSGSTDILVDVFAWFSTEPTVATAVEGGEGHTCAITQATTVECWGVNTYGQIGDNSTTERETPVPVSSLTGVNGLALGSGHACALLSNGTVKCWGRNDWGQLGDNTTTQRRTPVTVTGLTGVTAIAAGGYSSCAVLATGQVKCWGSNSNGKLGDGTTVDRHSPVFVSGLSNVSRLAVGGSHACATSSGGAMCWGANSFGQIGDGTTANRFAPVAVSGVSGALMITAGRSHSCVRVTGWTVRCWGKNEMGQLGDGTQVNRLTPVDVVGPASVTQLVAGRDHTCAKQSDGVGWCWGDNYYGQVAPLPATAQPSPVQLNGVTDWTTLGAGEYHSCGIREVGVLYCWGSNEDGELGTGTGLTSGIPRRVAGY